MIRILAIGIGAGLASALLFAAVITGSPLAIALSYAAPLPILIAALGWHHRAGLVAAATGALLIALALRPVTGLAFAIGSGLPAWWIAYLALLGREAAGDAAAPIEWFPLGRLLAWIAALAALVVFAGSVALGGGDHAAYRGLLQRLIEAFMRAEGNIAATGRLPEVAGMEGSSLTAIVVTLVPAIAASVFCLFFVANTWLAARTVAISGRLARPWPFIPATRMPAAALVALAGGVLASLLPGYLNVAGLAVVGALSMAFALQGLAFLHHVSAGRPGRQSLLVCTYVLTIFFGGTILPLMGIVGLVDTASPLRERFIRPAGPPPA